MPSESPLDGTSKVETRRARRAGGSPAAHVGYRPINLVLQGGGTLGIAHVGALAALEELGYRFVGLAGASAGAIVAVLIAAARRRVDDRVAGELRAVLNALPAADFVDGPYRVRALIKRLVPPRAARLSDLLLLPNAAQALRVLVRKGGLNAGDAFQQWLAAVLEKRFGIATIDDLRRRVNDAVRADERFADADWEQCLVITTTALPLGIRMLLPRDLAALRADRNVRSPALMVRASMAVPGFFTPLVLPTAGDGWQSYADRRVGLQITKREAGGVRGLPSVALVDGGLLSNFPIDAFRPERPEETNPCAQIPTLGISLTRTTTLEEWNPKGLGGAIGSATTMFAAARMARDREARARSPEGDQIVFVDTGPHNWLDFSLADWAKQDLFDRGYRAVMEELAPRVPLAAVGGRQS